MNMSTMMTIFSAVNLLTLLVTAVVLIIVVLTKRKLMGSGEGMWLAAGIAELVFMVISPALHMAVGALGGGLPAFTVLTWVLAITHLVVPVLLVMAAVRSYPDHERGQAVRTPRLIAGILLFLSPWLISFVWSLISSVLKLGIGSVLTGSAILGVISSVTLIGAFLLVASAARRIEPGHVVVPGNGAPVWRPQQPQDAHYR